MSKTKYIGKTFEELPGELFEEYPGYGYSYSIHEGLIYANWRPPVKWSPEVRDKLFETFELGFSASMAAWSLKLSRDAVDSWLRRGEIISTLISQGLAPHPDFRRVALVYRDIYEGAMEAKAQGIRRRVDRVESATEWRAQAWLLEKLVPEFSPKQTISMNVDFSKLSDEELERIARTGKL